MNIITIMYVKPIFDLHFYLQMKKKTFSGDNDVYE